MADSLKQQFDTIIPNFKDYAEAAASIFAKYFKDFKEEDKPELLLEPGSALVGDAMRFVSRLRASKMLGGNILLLYQAACIISTLH